MENANKGRLGFTLIELLVVVLIIGILAAIALPLYQVAVVKSRIASITPLLASIKQAEEAFYLENGTYSRNKEDTSGLDKWNRLSVELPENCLHIGSGAMKCDQYFNIDLVPGSVYKMQPRIMAIYCPSVINKNNIDKCAAAADFAYHLWFTHSDSPNKVECTPFTSLGTKVCKSLHLQ